MATTLPIHERFSTWQGEGVHMGRAAFFIRTFGCPQKCPWCDSAGTWHPDYVPKKINRMTPAELAAEALVSLAPFVVVTGGEPAIHDLSALIEELHVLSLRAHIETSGAYPISVGFDWITLSPKDKWARPALAENYLLADEIKLIIESPDDLLYWSDVLNRMGVLRPDGPVVWLHPEHTKRNDAEVLNAISHHVKLHRDPFRAGWQLHKLYRADALDVRAAGLVPLGGNPALGT